ncbi:unnamed protein product [Taenia asiatica]|uniref:Lipocalin-like domain-containing protein n=1 Tax=Taenia asiatica TaxID=60517 RepID=A0A0R3WBS6_TAEAS|nr:unnamed protein product [Taenia asiatica]
MQVGTWTPEITEHTQVELKATLTAEEYKGATYLFNMKEDLQLWYFLEPGTCVKTVRVHLHHSVTSMLIRYTINAVGNQM